jgi:hypothetical protein
LDAISRWSAEKKLLLNLRKLQAILNLNSAVGMVLPSLFLSMEEIPWYDAVIDRGVVIDGRLHFDRQVTKVCSWVYATLHRLLLLKFLTPKRVILKLCKAFLLSYFFYCDVIFSHLSSIHIRRLPMAFNSCTKYVFNLCHYENLSTSRNELLVLPLFDHYEFFVFLFFLS